MPNTFADLLRSSLMKLHPDDKKEIERFMGIIIKRHPEQMNEEIPEPYYSLLFGIFVAAHMETSMDGSVSKVTQVLTLFEEEHGKLTLDQKDLIMGMAERIFKTFQPLDHIIKMRRERSGESEVRVSPDADVPLVDSKDYDESKHGKAQGMFTFVPGIGPIKVSTQN